VALAQIAGGTLDPTLIPKYKTPMLIPPVMPRAGTKPGGVEYYEISMRQITQHILPAGFDPTTVWGYGGLKAQSNHGLPYPQRPLADDRSQIQQAGPD
jgi:spore coat protein A, manganese oxidase